MMRHKVTTDLLYPNLWRGCVGAWSPILGPSGTTLRDQSGFGNHGTLTNMDAASDWVVSGGRHALDFDGSNDHVVCGTGSSLNVIDLTLAAWIYSPSGSPSGYVASKRDGATISFGLVWLNTDAFLAFGADGVGTTTSTYGTYRDRWVHIAMTFFGTRINVYLNGINIASATVTAPSVNSSVPLIIGARGNTLPSVAAVFTGKIDEVFLYNRRLWNSEISLLASHRGVAYEIKRRSRGYVAAGGGNRRRRVLIGAG